MYVVLLYQYLPANNLPTLVAIFSLKNNPDNIGYNLASCLGTHFIHENELR